MCPQITLKWLPLLALIVIGCTPCTSRDVLQPKLSYQAPCHIIDSLPSPFPPLSQEENSQSWAKELILGDAFARELDLYRAITCYKSALILLPQGPSERRLQITYDIILAYYLGQKYIDAVNTFETSDLAYVNAQFPAFNNLLIILFDAYQQSGQCEKGEKIFETIQHASEETARDLTLYEAVKEGNLCTAEQVIACHPEQEKLQGYFDCYYDSMLSPSKARFLNAVLPGAGYYYVGQKKSALTSFLINALFTAAAYQLFDRGYTAGGIIVSSLELGWYWGGINGAGIEAQEYNNQIYRVMGTKLLVDEKIFPVLMFETTF